MDCKTNERTGSKSELKEICAFDSINDILGYTKTYTTEKDFYYYYMYELKICSSADKSLVYNSITHLIMKKLYAILGSALLALPVMAQEPQLPNNGFEDGWGACTPWT